MLKALGESGREFDSTFVAAHPAPNLQPKGDDDDFQHAITASEFTVQFNDGTLIDGSNRKVIPGRYISLIRGRYQSFTRR